MLGVILSGEEIVRGGSGSGSSCVSSSSRRLRGIVMRKLKGGGGNWTGKRLRTRDGKNWECDRAGHKIFRKGYWTRSGQGTH